MRKVIAVILSAVCANAPAFELAMTPHEKAACENEGGCIVISDKLLRALLGHARTSCERGA